MIMNIIDFKTDAKGVVDLLFDAKLFREHITRDKMNDVEEYINFLLTTRYKAQSRAEKFAEEMDKASKED